MSEPQLIQNAVKILEEDVYIKSAHQHDFVTHTFKDGKTSLSIDGGLAYARRAGDFIALDTQGRYEEWCLTDADRFDVIADRLIWGTRGKTGDQPLAYRPIKEFSIEHLTAILANVPNISPWHKRVVEYWLEMKTKEVAQ